MKKILISLLSLLLVVSLLAGCGKTEKPVEEATALKTGLSISTSLSSSKAATADKAGVAQADITLVAVLVGDDGIIDSCVIDGLQGKINFDITGKLATPTDTVFKTKNELGPDYGMVKYNASKIGKEWNEQAAAFAAYCVGKTVEQVKGIAVNAEGAPSDADLAASVSISVGSFIAGVEDAVKNATAKGAVKGDTLSLVATANASKSKDASDADGQGQVYATVAALTTKDSKITSCTIDAVQATVKFNASGVITTDLATVVQTKNQLGDNYGMKSKSSIGKEWYEQAAAFSAYVTGKTLTEVAGIAVDAEGTPTGADLTASVTVGVGDFLTIIAKAAK